ncbi:MAG: hypothetical protein Q7S31_00985 [bacterium]|nr:hypothetical protein [bacterium]
MAKDIPSLTPGPDFYEWPYVPSALEMDDYKTIPLSAVEANTILVNSTGSQLSPAIREALLEASEIGADEEIDLKNLIKKFMSVLYGD